VKHRSLSATRPVSLAIAAGLAAGLSAAAPALAVSDTRLQLRWFDWDAIDVLGSDVVIGSLDGGQPNVNHASFDDANIVQIAYPLPFQFGDQVFNRIDFVSPHATAALGAIGARNENIGSLTDFGGIIGFAPESSLIAGSFAATLDSFSGNFRGTTNESILFALLGMTDQDFADAIWEPLGLPQRYRVASVINMAFGQAGSNSQRAGTDGFAQLANVAASMTNATFIAAAGNQGANEQLEDLEPPQGSMASPGSAHNVIAVGFTEQGLGGGIAEESSRGPQVAADWRVDAQLLPADPNDFPLGSPPPTVSPVSDARNGVAIVAPGVEMSLPGNPAGNALNNTNFSTAWTGTSFSSAIVAGAVGLLHDLHRKIYFETEPDAGDEFDPNAILPPIVTKAILFNSANKENDWDNGGSQGDDEGVDPGATTTTTPFDTDLGSGRLDMRRLMRQYMATPGLGGYRDITPDNLDINGQPLVEAFRRNPDITDPEDPRMDQGQIPSQPPSDPDEVEAGYILLDEDGFPLRVPGTDPTIPLIQTFANPDSGEGAGGPGGGPIRQKPDDAVDADRSSPHTAGPTVTVTEGMSTDMQPMQQLIPPGDFGDNDGFGGGDGGGGLGSTWTGGNLGGEGGGGGSGGGSGGGTTTGGFGGQLFATGWDHGMIGKGTLDLPIGLLSEGSTLSVTLTWHRRMILDQRVIDALAASILPQNLQVASNRLLSNPATRREIEKTAPFLPSAKRALDYLESLEAPDRVSPGLADEPTGEPTVMAGVRIPADAQDPPIPPAESDTPAMRVDPNADSPFNGVCYMEIPSVGRKFTGVAIGPRQILTAAHPFDIDNNGTRDTSFSDLRLVFNGVPVDDGNGGVTFQQLVFNSGSVERIDINPAYVGIGFNTSNPPQNRGFENDIAVVTLRADANGQTNLNLFDLGVFTYTPQPAGSVNMPGTEVLIVGYGESGQGDEGFAPVSELPILSSTKRVGANLLDDVGDKSYEYDFDGPGAPFLEGPFDTSRSLGNTNFGSLVFQEPILPNQVFSGFGETLHAEGDSGSAAFLWFDSGDGMGGPPDGMIQGAELRLFGINTYRRIGNAVNMGGFGTIGGGQTLAGYADFIDSALNPDPPLPPGDIGPDVLFDDSSGLLVDLVGFDVQKLNLEVWRLSFDGAGNRLAGNSTSEWEQVELVFLDGEDEVPTGFYFARIVYEGTQWDFGGFRFAGVESIRPQLNLRGNPFQNFFDGDIEYALAWYADIINDPNLFPTRSIKTYEDFMGDMNADAAIDGSDVGALLSLWGSAPDSGRGDLNGDGVVDAGDLNILLGNYTGPRIEPTVGG